MHSVAARPTFLFSASISGPSCVAKSSAYMLGPISAATRTSAFCDGPPPCASFNSGSTTPARAIATRSSALNARLHSAAVASSFCAAEPSRARIISGMMPPARVIAAWLSCDTDESSQSDLTAISFCRSVPWRVSPIRGAMPPDCSRAPKTSAASGASGARRNSHDALRTSTCPPCANRTSASTTYALCAAAAWGCANSTSAASSSQAIGI
mmetsp:Transcript_32678/g.76198  ORF Transcript_32678/g.76198 Transcript_32678/m.76198 type:complete len:211 (-) Transcript_32678:99-731(-)